MATTGSTAIARRAGIHAATLATNINPTAAESGIQRPASGGTDANAANTRVVSSEPPPPTINPVMTGSRPRTNTGFD